MAIKYGWFAGPFAASNPDMLRECSDLYSTHYGRWSAAGPRPGDSVHLSPARIRPYLRPESALIVTARDAETLVGYATAVVLKVKQREITWVTQLVVHSDYRKQGVATDILFNIWTFSDQFAWGIVSANPFAIRALEKATRRRCDPQRIRKHRDTLLSVAHPDVPYIGPGTEAVIRSDTCRINTEFPIDHNGIPEMLQKATANREEWRLGELKPGWEWIAFTFNDQDQFKLTKKEITAMIQASDEVVRSAYSRMTLDGKHKWAAYTDEEVDFIVEACGVDNGSSVLDLGCGTGRHIRRLAANGVHVAGVDYAEELIRKAEQKSYAADVQADFIVGDVRTINLHEEFDVVLCLYDVIGSFAEPTENMKIVRNILRHLRPGGTALVSVMNRALTEKRAKHRFKFSEDPNPLLTLKPSSTMEKSGNVFDPEFYLLDSSTGVVYRKEQFHRGEEMPKELIVRDRRYYLTEIRDLLVRAGLEVSWARCVRAGDWVTALPEEDDHAKEVLLLCRKPE